MRVLLDECVDRRLLRYLAGHAVTSVSKQGWAGIKNGRLLALAEQSFEVFVTMDSDLSFQQTLQKYDIGIVVVRARSNRLADLLPLVPNILTAIISVAPGEATIVE